jgi:heme ABC exporter ATP-binding subunit CcmA
VERSVTAGAGGAAIELEGVTRRFSRKWALRGVSLRVEEGEVVGVEGHNGSGKSTLLSVVATLIRPTAGEIRLRGIDARRDPASARGLVGMLSHSPGIYDGLTARENLHFASTMLGVGSGGIDSILDRVGLLREADERVGRFSSGMQRRVALGRLMLRVPQILLLDEPYNSFDPDGVALVNDLIRDVSRHGGATLVVLHDRLPAMRVLDRHVRLRQGRLEPDVAAESQVSPRSPVTAVAG